MSASHKKVILRRLSPGPLWGYLPASDLLQGGVTDAIGLLDLGGKVHPVLLADVKYVCYVRDFNTADTLNPERLTRRTFLGRPRTEGLLLRMTLRDGDQIEGLAALDSSFADGWAQDRGVYLTPPDIRGNTQRMFVPRVAITTLEIVAVITTPSRKKLQAAAAVEDRQPDLFSLPLPPGARTN